MSQRYNKITWKNQREIVLLKSFPCIYGKCSFCTYIEDNSTDEAAINIFNLNVLKNITWEFWVLEVINSWSIFEIPQMSLDAIKKIIISKKIKKIFVEAYYGYKNRLQEIEDFFGI